MTVKRSTDLLDVLDRVLDRGIVIEAWAGVSLAGIHLVDVEARILVASCPTYVSLADAVAAAAPVVTPALAAPRAAAASSPLRTADSLPTREIGRPRRPPGRRRSAPRATGPRTWVCDHGCTFRRSGRWRQAVIPCPYDKGSRCPVRTA